MQRLQVGDRLLRAGRIVARERRAPVRRDLVGAGAGGLHLRLRARLLERGVDAAGQGLAQFDLLRFRGAPLGAGHQHFARDEEAADEHDRGERHLAPAAAVHPRIGHRAAKARLGRRVDEAALLERLHALVEDRGRARRCPGSR